MTFFLEHQTEHPIKLILDLLPNI